MTLEERWRLFSKRDQIGNIASELFRAQGAANDANVKIMLERALELADLSLADPRWRDDIYMMLIFRNKIAELYSEDASSEKIEQLCAIL